MVRAVPGRPQSRQQPSNGQGGNGASRTRERILDAAQRLFARHGFGSTSTKAIADEAGVAAGLVFYYFPSKQALLDTIITERSFERELHAILDAANPGDLRATLRDLGLGFLHVLRERREVGQILLRTLSSEPEVTNHLQALLGDSFVRLSDYLIATIGPDRIDGPHARALARAFMASIVFATFVLPPVGDGDAFIDHTLDVLLAAYTPAPAT